MQLAIGKTSLDQSDISSIHTLYLCGLGRKHMYSLLSQLHAEDILHEAELPAVHQSFLTVVQGKILVLPWFGRELIAEAGDLCFFFFFNEFLLFCRICHTPLSYRSSFPPRVRHLRPGCLSQREHQDRCWVQMRFLEWCTDLFQSLIDFKYGLWLWKMLTPLNLSLLASWVFYGDSVSHFLGTVLNGYLAYWCR